MISQHDNRATRIITVTKISCLSFIQRNVIVTPCILHLLSLITFFKRSTIFFSLKFNEMSSKCSMFFKTLIKTSIVTNYYNQCFAFSFNSVIAEVVWFLYDNGLCHERVNNNFKETHIFLDVFLTNCSRRSFNSILKLIQEAVIHMVFSSKVAHH